jgi:TolA-binding protein
MSSIESTTAGTTIAESTAAATVIATTTDTTTRKPAYKSRYTELYERASHVMQKMQKQHNEGVRELAQVLKDLQSRVQRLERDADKHEARSQRRKQNTGPEQSFQGVNQCKRVNPELHKFLQENTAQMSEGVRDLVRPIMSLNEVNRCVLAIGKTVGVVVEVASPKDESSTAAKNRSSWFYVLTKTDTPAGQVFVDSLRRLLVDLWPAGIEGQINMAEQIEIRKMSRYFKHLLTVDEESQKYVAGRIEEKRTQMTSSAAAAAAAASAADIPETPSSAMDSVAASAVIEAISAAVPMDADAGTTRVSAAATEPSAKKRKLARNKPAPTAE